MANSVESGVPDQSPFPQGLRVLMLAPSYLPRLGGVERHVRSVVQQLACRDVEIRIATPRWEDDWLEDEVLDGIQVKRLSRVTQAGRRELAPWVGWADVVHTHDAYPFYKYYLPFRVRHRRLPVFVTFHGYEGYPIPLEARVLRRLLLWLTRDSICAGAFIPKWYRFRCTHVTHGGVDAPASRPAPGEGAVFVGRLARDTGFLAALETARLLKEEHGVSLPLAVCGDGELRAEGNRIAESAGFDVTFHGQVSDVMPYLAGARFAFVTGLLTMLEAMASGAIVLSLYDNPLKEDYLRLSPGARYAIISDSPAELALRVAELMASPDTVEVKTAEAYEFARTQTWSKVADLYAGLYRSVAPRGGRA